jgi:sterol desaturase/sphingolipid hydroxylase (fatty acid hydroxylase superfamily)
VPLHVVLWKAILLLIGGFCLWGVMEYFMHRYTFHHAPIFKAGHGEHHKQPKLHIGTPFFITLPIYFLIAWPIAALFGYDVIACLLSGFIVGYFGYLICHHVVHNKRIQPDSFWHRYKKFHDLHHYKQDVNFGVSWQMWDRVFGTYRKS